MQARFDAALAAFEVPAEGPIGLAVSGGGDSMALLHMAADWAGRTGQALTCFTVDHGLRTEATAEAAMVAEVCGDLAVAHKTLTWDAPNTSQARARDARHRMLASAMTTAGGTLLLTGHTASDNAESFLIRARAGSGWYGLAGMATRSISPVWPEGQGLTIARPMLGMQRDEVRTWLDDKGSEWVEDPSNQNPAYERVRMRTLLSKAPQLPVRIARIQAHLHKLRTAEDASMAAWLTEARDNDGTLSLPPASVLPEPTLARAISLAVMAASGSDRPPRSERARAAAVRLQTENTPLTLGGTYIRLVQARLHISPESNRPNAPTALESLTRIAHICEGLRDGHRK